MIYVLSDIHGQRRRFDSILNQINLQPEDTLYVLGDVIDRNYDGIRILRQLMAMPNVKMLLGNHEYMMLDALYYPPPSDILPRRVGYYRERIMSRWYRNGGDITHGYLKRIPKTIRKEIFEYLDKLPVNIEITVNDKQYVLTHAAPVELYSRVWHKHENEKEFAVWQRFENFVELDNKTVIFGHTPTYRYNFENPMQIWNAGGWIGIDCGCMYPDEGDPWSDVYGRLACLRLDDMKEFYSEEPFGPEDVNER